MSSVDASKRGIREGDVVRVFNDRGACLAGARVSDSIRQGVVQLATGAWFDPVGEGTNLDRHGTPNVLTLDRGTSRLAQGPSAMTTLVEVERLDGTGPPVEAFRPPSLIGKAEGLDLASATIRRSEAALQVLTAAPPAPIDWSSTDG
jgi:biotin/methionine sulfoxide reductase